MKTAKSAYPRDFDETVSAAEPTKPVERKTSMHIRRVVTETVELPYDPENGQKTYGQILDNFIWEALSNRGQVQFVEFEITDADWHRMEYEHSLHKL
jgi:hypothetical protein